jgi:hypothetical protein
MASPQELKMVRRICSISSLVGSQGNKMKKIVNSYMINRYIANRMKPGIPSDSVFYKKLLKFTMLLEQWPYQMPWMLFLVEENLQQEHEIENRTRTCTGKQARRSSIEIGESLPSILPSARRLNSKNNKRG